MTNSIRLIFVLHDHQPVGNFDHVFEQAYEDSYRRFLDVFERYETLKIGLHTSGPLLEWLEEKHPDYLDRVARLVNAGRIEIIGGAFYEPILSMIPRHDRIGQIESFSRLLERRFGAPVRGMWIPERVWEQNMTSDLVAAGIQYTMLDDFHFKNAGLSDDQLHGYYLTEDEGNVLAVFPDSEPLRYMIPFRMPQETIDYLGRVAARHPGAVAVFGDDGEKFGAWPETKKHCYDDGWLAKFFDLLAANGEWIKSVTPAEVLDATAPVDKVYLPEGSYREMTEWVLPAEQLAEYAAVRRELEHDPRWPRIARFVRGGFWRNFRVKYPEANEMYARMMMVSRRLQAALEAGATRDLVEQARTALYRGQCNCAYWHGAFGGVYLPHLRNAVYRQLITADNLLCAALHKPDAWVELTSDDYTFDGRQEVQLAGDRLVALAAPARGGMLYELDVRRIAHNLLATLTRRPEAYHRKVLAGADARNDIAGVMDRVIFKQEGLDSRIQYDAYPRKSLIDHFYDRETTLAAVAGGEAPERGDFHLRPYEARLRRNPQRMQLQLSCQGNAGDVPIKITKSLTLAAGSSALEIAYLVEGLPKDRPLLFAVEFNFAGLPAGADDRYFYGHERSRLGQLGSRLDLADAAELGLVDEWLGVDVNLGFSRPTGLWTFPIESVSQSEAGFELVHQSVAVLPHWLAEADENGRWSVAIHLAIDTSLAESRQEEKQKPVLLSHAT
ncbi:MAG: alpha-amylase/4-alpha-glucanotransferase domain-containing protein [Pirellulales bacterium]